MRKRLLAWILCIALVFGMCGCGTQEKNSVEEVLKKFEEAELPIIYSIVYTDDNDPNGEGKHSYQQKGNFADERHGEYSKEEPTSGTIEIFDSAEKAKERMEYVQGFATLDSYGYYILSGEVFLRLSPEFSVEEAEAYAKAIGGEIVFQKAAESRLTIDEFVKRFNAQSGTEQIKEANKRRSDGDVSASCDMPSGNTIRLFADGEEVIKWVSMYCTTGADSAAFGENIATIALTMDKNFSMNDGMNLVSGLGLDHPEDIGDGYSGRIEINGIEYSLVCTVSDSGVQLFGFEAAIEKD